MIFKELNKMESVSKEPRFEKFIGRIKDLSLLIIIPMLFLLSNEHEVLKTVLVLYLAILFLVEGFVLFSNQKTSSLINLGVGLFFIGMIIFI